VLPGSYTLTVSKAGFGQRGRLSMVALSGSVAFQNAVARFKQGTSGRFMSGRWKYVFVNDKVCYAKLASLRFLHQSSMCFFSILIFGMLLLVKLASTAI